MSPVMLYGAPIGTLDSSSSVIKSIQARSLSFAAADVSKTDTTFNAVTAANTILIYNGVTTNDTVQAARAAIRITLTDGSTVTAVRENGTTNTAVINYTIVEFASGVNSIQYGNILTSAGTGTATLSPGMGTNGFVMWLGNSIATAGLGPAGILSGVTLTNATTVTASSVAAATTVNFCAVDLDTTVVTSAQNVTKTSTAASGTDTVAITAVSDIANCSFFPCGHTNAVAGFGNAYYYGELTSTILVTWTRNGTVGTGSRTHWGSVVEWKSSVLAANKTQRVNSPVTLTAATSATAAITSVVTTKAFATWNGFKGANANDNAGLNSSILTDATTVTIAVNTAGTIVAPFEVTEFA